MRSNPSESDKDEKTCTNNTANEWRYDRNPGVAPIAFTFT